MDGLLLADGVLRIAGITSDGNDITCVCYRNLEDSARSYLNVIAVVAEVGTIGLDDHRQTVLLDVFYLTALCLA